MSESKDLMITFDVDGEQVKLSPNICQDYIVSGNGKLTLPEFKFFTTLCKKMRLNPYAKDCYIMKYSDNQPATIITSKDVIFRRAMSHPDFDGLENGVIVQKKDGTTEERAGGFVNSDETLVGAWAKTYRKNIKYPYYISVSLDEVVQRKKDGTANSIWATKPAMMAIKVASVRVLREMFTEELQGLYDADEIKNEQTDSVKNTGFSTQDINITEPDIEVVDIDEETGEVKEKTNKVNLEDL